MNLPRKFTDAQLLQASEKLSPLALAREVIRLRTALRDVKRVAQEQENAHKTVALIETFKESCLEISAKALETE